ncbi:MAG: 6,7-dimethyl-8-ribityllumazine synthase [Calditrichaeota bacterium]|nr:6,7-dimethyl-8-ribityllumazine synthase [Calditrichota bacterium]
MIEVIEGHLDARGRKFAIVAGRFNALIGNNLIDGAVDCLMRHGAAREAILICKVPGAVEIPLAAQKLSRNPDIDAVIGLAVIIRGATPHFDYVAGTVSTGLANLALESGKPMAFGVLTTDTIEQAVERAGTKAGNKGWDAALTAIEMVNLLEKI